MGILKLSLCFGCPLSFSLSPNQYYHIHNLSACTPLCQSVCLSVYLPIYLPISFSLSVFLFLCLSLNFSVSHFLSDLQWCRIAWTNPPKLSLNDEPYNLHRERNSHRGRYWYLHRWDVLRNKRKMIRKWRWWWRIKSWSKGDERGRGDDKRGRSKGDERGSRKDVRGSSSDDKGGLSKSEYEM